MTITRPLLAGTVENVDLLNFPLLASPKLDGIRILKIDGKVLTRKFKELPNKHARNVLQKILPDGIDGEIMLRMTDVMPEFNNIQSQLMSFDGEPDFVFHAFDYAPEHAVDLEFHLRLKNLKTLDLDDQLVKLVKHVRINNADELLAYESKCLIKGYEGVMLRDPYGRYKCGRSTLKEQILLKLKRWEDSEAKILGVEELMINTNEKEVNELGLSKRSHKKEGKIAGNTLGSFLVEDIHNGKRFSLGSGEGFTKESRKSFWDNKDILIGNIVKYKFQPVGVKDLPRFPGFIGFRHPDDIGGVE